MERYRPHGIAGTKGDRSGSYAIIEKHRPPATASDIWSIRKLVLSAKLDPISYWMSDLNASIKEKMAELTGGNSDSGYYQLPRRTEAEQMQKNQELIEWYRKWAEEGDEEEQRETLEYLQKALDEDRLSNRPLFAQK